MSWIPKFRSTTNYCLKFLNLLLINLAKGMANGALSLAANEISDGTAKVIDAGTEFLGEWLDKSSDELKEMSTKELME